jgi:type IV fimbrial biogenesis protein FimT
MRTQQHIEGHAASGQNGFTLIEIMVAIAIAAVLAGIAVPSLTGFTRNSKLNSINSSLVASLQQARSEAIKLNQGVLVCPSDPSTPNTCKATTNWGANGWLVCYDGNADSACDASTSSLPNPIKIENKVDATFATVVGPSPPIRFGPNGNLTSSAATLSVTGTWNGASAHAVSVAATGLIKGTRLTGIKL